MSKGLLDTLTGGPWRRAHLWDRAGRPPHRRPPRRWPPMSRTAAVAIIMVAILAVTLAVASMRQAPARPVAPGLEHPPTGTTLAGPAYTPTPAG